jgi:hypothetical protein
MEGTTVVSRSSLAIAVFLGLLLFLSGAKADHHHNKNKDADALTECTIQQPGGGGGCKAGFKRVCQKLKNGDKCCGCVPDKDAKTTTPESDQGSKGTTTTTDTTSKSNLPYTFYDRYAPKP